MRILHISDFHLENPIGTRTGPILARLCDFIAANANDVYFSHIVITGDLRNARDGAECSFVKNTVDQIIQAANITDKRRIHIVPGNHDLKRSDNDKTEISKVRTNYKWQEGTFADSDNCISMMNARFNEFFWPFCENFYGIDNPWSDCDNSIHTLRLSKDWIDKKEYKSAFIYVNSCITCIGSHEDDGLILGLYYLDEKISILENDVDNLFFLAHHPIQNLNRDEESKLQEFVRSCKCKNIFWLCGDAHSSRDNDRKYIRLCQVGSVTGISNTLPEFAIYDIEMNNHNKPVLHRRIFRFLPHLNSTSPRPGGWKCVCLD